MGKVMRFPGRHANPPPAAAPRVLRGEVCVFPCGDDNGCWGVDHTSESGDSVGLIGTWMRLKDAQAAAKEAAERMGARLVEGICP